MDKIGTKINSACAAAKFDYRNAEYGTADRVKKHVVSMILANIDDLSSPDSIVDMMPQCVLNEFCGNDEDFDKFLAECTEEIVNGVANYLNKITK